MEISGGGGGERTKRAKPSEDGERTERAKSAEDGEDRLGALHDDLLLRILVKLDTTVEAVRTSVLARRWREVWRGLPVVRLNPAPDGNRTRDLLDALHRPELRLISITASGPPPSPDSAAAWLSAASRRLTGALVYDIGEGTNGDDEIDVDDGRGYISLPCFEKATDVLLSLGFLVLVLPSTGKFGRLAELSLYSVQFRADCNFSSMVSSQRCPALKILQVNDSRGLQEVSINSKSLLRIDLSCLWGLRVLMIASPTLQKLSVESCFHQFNDYGQNEWAAKISAPKLFSLKWADAYDPGSMDLGNTRLVQELKTHCFFVHGQLIHIQWNQHCMRLLKRFKALDYLNLQLVHAPNANYQYLMDDITALPQIMFLHVDLDNTGHSLGASLFHLLRICPNLIRFLLELKEIKHKAHSACPSDCICNQPGNWKIEEIELNSLEHVAIGGLQGIPHEISFVKQLLRWGKVLKKVRIKFDKQIKESKAREFSHAVGSPRPEIDVEIYTFDDESNKWTLLPRSL